MISSTLLHRWGDSSNLLESKYGQSGTGVTVGQPCGLVRAPANSPGCCRIPYGHFAAFFSCGARRLYLATQLVVQTALTQIIEEELDKEDKAGKEKSDVTRVTSTTDSTEILVTVGGVRSEKNPGATNDERVGHQLF